MSESDPVVQHNPFPPAPPLPAHLDTLTHQVLAMVLAERERQIEKGYDAKHDDGHVDEELPQAAALIAVPNGRILALCLREWCCELATHIAEKHSGDRVKILIIAAALLVAEVERLERAKAKAPAESAAEMTARADAHVAAVQSGDEEPERWDGQS